MAKSKAEFFSMGQSDFIGAYKNNNRYAIARREYFFARESWQALAYFEGYQAGGRAYWAALGQMCEELKAGKPITECVNLEQVDAAIESGNAIIAAPVMVEGKMPVHATRKQLLGMFKARKVMKADYTNRNNTLNMRLAAKNAYTELCSRMRCELVNGARTRVVSFGWDKV
jgi:hypothetical protein